MIRFTQEVAGQTQQKAHQHSWRTIAVRYGLGRHRQHSTQRDARRNILQADYPPVAHAKSELEGTVAPGSKLESGSMAAE